MEEQADSAVASTPKPPRTFHSINCDLDPEHDGPCNDGGEPAPVPEDHVSFFEADDRPYVVPTLHDGKMRLLVKDEAVDLTPRAMAELAIQILKVYAEQVGPVRALVLDEESGAHYSDLLDLTSATVNSYGQVYIKTLIPGLGTIGAANEIRRALGREIAKKLGLDAFGVQA